MHYYMDKKSRPQKDKDLKQVTQEVAELRSKPSQSNGAAPGHSSLLPSSWPCVVGFRDMAWCCDVNHRSGLEVGKEVQATTLDVSCQWASWILNFDLHPYLVALSMYLSVSLISFSFSKMDRNKEPYMLIILDNHRAELSQGTGKQTSLLFWCSPRGL